MTLPRRLTICNERGLHARAARKFVETAARFEAEVWVSHDGQRVRADSIMELLMLAAASGCAIEVDALGPDAEAAADALAELVADRFGEGA